MDRLQRLACLEKTTDVVDSIIEQCYPLMMKQLQKFYLYNDPDALSHAYEALYNAINTYIADGRSKFITYATVCIYNSLGSYLRILKNTQQPISIHTIISETGEELAEMLSTGENMEANVVGEDTAAIYRILAARIISNTSNEKQSAILKHWMESDFTMKHTDLALLTVTSQSYVTQTINTFRAKFRKEMEAIGHGERI